MGLQILHQDNFVEDLGYGCSNQSCPIHEDLYIFLLEHCVQNLPSALDLESSYFFGKRIREFVG